MAKAARDLLGVPNPVPPGRRLKQAAARKRGETEMHQNKIQRTSNKLYETTPLGLKKLINIKGNKIKEPYQSYKCSYKCGR